MKRLLSIFTAVSLLFGLFCIPVSAEEETLSAVEHTKEYEFVNGLFGVSEILGETEKEVTRMQFLKAFTQIFGYTYSEENQVVSFTDVDRTAEEYEILKAAVQAGLISDASLFRPDDAITLNECLKIISVPAGYGAKAEIIGGYPAGYSMMAYDLNITDGISKSVPYMTVSSVYTLLYNLMHANIIEITSVESGSVGFGTNIYETVLSSHFGIYATEGIMNAGEYTMLGNENYEPMEDMIQVNGVQYKTDKDLNGYVGYNVTVYYTADGNVKTAVYADASENNTVEIICNDDCTYSNLTVSYYKDENSKKKTNEKLVSAFDYIYNGKVYYGYTNATFVPKTGTLTLVDNNGDGKYDVVVANEYYYMQILGVDKINKIITSKYNSTEKADLGADGVVYTIFSAETQNYAGVDALSIDSVIAVKLSRDKKLYEIIMCDSYIDGTVSEISTKDKKIKVNDAFYNMSYEFVQNDLTRVAAGKSYSLYLGLYGEIVLAEEAVASMDYGFLAARNQSGTFTQKYEVKIFTKMGEFKIYELSEKVIVDGKPDKDYSRIESALTPGGVFEGQLVKYLVTDGKVSKIDTAETTTDLMAGLNDSSDNSLRKFDIGTSTPSYRQKIFWPGFNIDGSLIFQIPNDLTDEESYRIGGSFTDGTGNGAVIPYDINLGGSAGAIVNRTDGVSTTFGASYKNSKFILVEEVLTSVNDEGEAMRMVRGWSEGSLGSWFIDDGVTVTKKGIVSELVKGDLIRVIIANGLIKNIMVNFDASKFEVCDINPGADNLINPTGYSKSLGYQIGKVYSVSGSYGYLASETNKNADGTYVYNDMSKLINVMLPSSMAVYDVKSGEIKPASSSDIRTYLGHSDDASFMIIIQDYLYSYIGIIYNR